MDIAKRIYEARQARGLTQRQIADALRVSVQAVSQWESGKSVPKDQRLSKLFEILGIGSKGVRDGVPQIQEFKTIDQLKSDITKIPLILLSNIARYYASNDNEREKLIVDWISPSLPVIGTQTAVKLLDGDFLYIEFKVGDIIIFDSGVLPVEGDFVFVSKIIPKQLAKKGTKPGRFSINFDMSFSMGIAQASKKKADSENENADTSSEEEPSKALSDKPMTQVIGTMVERRIVRTAPPVTDEAPDIEFI